MLPVTAGIPATKRQIVIYTVLLITISISPVWVGASAIYGIGAALLGANFLRHALIVLTSAEPRNAMRMFGFSILYLFALFALLAADHLTQGLNLKGITVTLATAHPAKFPDAVKAATGLIPPLPAHLADLYEKTEHFTPMGRDLGALKAYIRGL
jgi:hypothetical protein